MIREDTRSLDPKASTLFGLVQGDTRSSDYSSYVFLNMDHPFTGVYEGCARLVGDVWVSGSWVSNIWASLNPKP